MLLPQTPQAAAPVSRQVTACQQQEALCDPFLLYGGSPRPAAGAAAPWLKPAEARVAAAAVVATAANAAAVAQLRALQEVMSRMDLRARISYAETLQRLAAQRSGDAGAEALTPQDRLMEERMRAMLCQGPGTLQIQEAVLSQHRPVPAAAEAADVDVDAETADAETADAETADAETAETADVEMDAEPELETEMEIDADLSLDAAATVPMKIMVPRPNRTPLMVRLELAGSPGAFSTPCLGAEDKEQRPPQQSSLGKNPWSFACLDDPVPLDFGARNVPDREHNKLRGDATALRPMICHATSRHVGAARA